MLGDQRLYATLTAEAAKLKPGQSGLLALDCNNGNRTVLVDPLLTGLLLGQTLYTTRAEIYRALIEATSLGARTIIERVKEYGVAIDHVVYVGGIAEKTRCSFKSTPTSPAARCWSSSTSACHATGHPLNR